MRKVIGVAIAAAIVLAVVLESPHLLSERAPASSEDRAGGRRLTDLADDQRTR